jgi:hypothetical protein
MTTKRESAKLPKEAEEALYACYAKKGDEIQIIADPQCEGTYAVQVTRMFLGKPVKHDPIVQLVWYQGDFDKVEFTQWPPVSDKLQFFV